MNQELRLVRALVFRDTPEAEALLASPDLNTARFLAFARWHQLGSFVYHAVARLDLGRSLPPPVLAAIKGTALLERLVVERLLEQMDSLQARFEREGLPVFFIKGPLFADRFYGSQMARSVSDLDVLVLEPEAMDAVDEVLRQAEFVPKVQLNLGRRVRHFFAHHVEYRRGDLPLDLHWSLQQHFTFTIDYDRIRRTATHHVLNGRSYPTTSDEYELVLQIIGALTDLQVGKLSLRTIVDIAHVLLTVGARTDWTDFMEQRRREHLHRASAYLLRLTLEALDCRSQFADLDEVLEPALRRLPPVDRAYDALAHSHPLDLRQKRLGLRLLEAPLPATAAWWAFSLPFRLAAYGITRPLRRPGARRDPS